MAKHTTTKRPISTITVGKKVWVFSRAVLPVAKQIIKANQITEHARGVYVTDAHATRPEVKTLFHTEPDAPYVFVTCTCPHAKASGFGRARCSHVLAALVSAFGGVEQ